MSVILCIETSTKACSSAICNESGVLASRFIHTGEFTHAESLNPMILDLMQEAGLSFSQLDAIAVSQGPGSYTGLRIGVSTAKGICYALQIPLIAVDTLELIARKAYKTDAGGALYLPMIDARRMEVYASLFDHELHQIEATSAIVIDENTFLPQIEKGKVIFCGDGALKCKALYGEQTNAHFINDLHPDAVEMCTIAQAKFKTGKLEDVAYFEPYYLKEFYTPQRKL